jgi:mannose-6-phosphate isomerase-like protein (cupin superfamily)
MSQHFISAGERLSRRELARIAIGAALGATALGWSRSSSALEEASSPAPGGTAVPGVFISAQHIAERIAQAEASVNAGKTHSGPQPGLLLLQNGFEVTLEWRNAPQDSLNMHLTDAEMFVILEGSGTMELGGTLVNPYSGPHNPSEGPTLTAAIAQGSTLYKVAKGDTIMIPNNTPHRVSQVDGRLALWSLHLPLPLPRQAQLSEDERGTTSYVVSDALLRWFV